MIKDFIDQLELIVDGDDGSLTCEDLCEVSYWEGKLEAYIQFEYELSDVERQALEELIKGLK